jgi:hypothetical protein
MSPINRINEEILANDILRDLVNETVVELIDNYISVQKENIDRLYAKKILKDEDLDCILEKAIKLNAKITYKNMIKNPENEYNKLGHIIHPEFFAYAIKHNVFTKDELSRIPSDNGLIIDEFVREFYRENTVKLYKNRILKSTPTSLPMISCWD